MDALAAAPARSGRTPAPLRRVSQQPRVQFCLGASSASTSRSALLAMCGPTGGLRLRAVGTLGASRHLRRQRRGRQRQDAQDPQAGHQVHSVHRRAQGGALYTVYCRYTWPTLEPKQAHSAHALACIRACAWRVPGISGGRGPPASRLAWSLWRGAPGKRTRRLRASVPCGRAAAAMSAAMRQSC